MNRRSFFARLAGTAAAGIAAHTIPATPAPVVLRTELTINRLPQFVAACHTHAVNPLSITHTHTVLPLWVQETLDRDAQQIMESRRLARGVR